MNHKYLILSAAFILSGLTAKAQTLVLFTQVDSKKDASQVILVDEDGKKTTVAMQALKIHGFSEGMAAILSMDKKYGFIDASGTLAVPCRFELAGPFFNGMAWAKEEKGKIGYIDKTGKWVIKPEYDAAKSFDPVSGVARVKKDGRWSYIDQSGKILPFATEAGFDFSEGLAVAEKGGLRGYINNECKWVIDPQFLDAKKFEKGYARVKLNGKWGVIDTSGNWVVEAQFEVLKDIDPIE